MKIGVQFEPRVIAFDKKKLDLIIEFIGLFRLSLCKAFIFKFKIIGKRLYSHGTDDYGSNPSPIQAFPDIICHKPNPR